jgi:hypothetical protein
MSGIVIDLVEARDELRKVQREIGRVNSKTQIDHLMKNRKDILARVDELEAVLEKRMRKSDSLDLRIFQTIHRAFAIYGRGVTESLFRKFEYDYELEPLEIVNHPETFRKCVEKLFGKRSSKEIVSSILFEICNEFGLQLSNRSDLADAIRIARASIPKLEYEGTVSQTTNFRSRY